MEEENENTENNAMSAALQNLIILQKILQNESVSGKTARLVSHFWNKTILTLPHPKLTLRLDTWQNCCSATPFQIFCLKMEPRLARSIHQRPLLDECDHSPGQILSSAESKLLQVSGQFGHLLENFTVACNNPDFITTLYEILQNCCPNLKRLEIDFLSPDLSKTDEEESEKRTDFDPCTLDKLISLKIDDTTRHPGYFKMTQWLLNSAPNLTHFFLQSSNQLPDLGQNGSIKLLEFKMDRFMKMSNLRGADYICGVNRILDQVKDTVEFLYFKVDLHHDDIHYDGGIDLHIPKLKKLKEFENPMLDLFSCGDKLQDICTERIPTLQSLRISTSTRKKSLNHVLRNIVEEKDLFSGVKNLVVMNLHGPELIAGLKTPFPNLERLSIDEWDANACPFIKMEPYLEAYASLGLKFLKIEMSNEDHEKFSHFIQGFSNCGELLSGLKGLEIRFSNVLKPFSDDLNLVEGGRKQMKQWLLQLKELEDVQISGIKLKMKTRKWMEPFIRKNKIPIAFK